ncbi:MAG TPA: hypothetical protein VG839_06910 [Asticcacaulis sp.]|nr:hypothetical protein [Asticcacaulis sp.]
MKHALAGLMAAGLLLSAVTAQAATREDLENQALDHANKADGQVTVGVDAFKAGDQAKGCAAFRVAYDELGQAIDLLDQDADVVRNDKSLSDAGRTTELNDVTGAREDAVKTRDLVGAQIQQRCQSTT